MAIYHLSVKAVSRAGGRSATAAAAYRSATLITDERTGQIHDYQRRGGVEAAFIVAPPGADWAIDRSALWNAAEAAERRKDAKVAREIQVALPHELDAGQHLALAREFAEGLVGRYGIAADVAVHAPSREGDQQNWHAHILTTTRTVSVDGLGAKVRVLDVPASARIAGPAEAMVKNPLGLRRAIRDLLDRSRNYTETRAVFLKRAEAEVDNPEGYGGLRGKTGLFAFPAARAERARALAAIPEIKAALIDLKSVFDEAVVVESERERTRCAAIRIPIPGLSPGTRAALRLFVEADGSASATLAALAALRAEPGGMAEVEAVRLALDERFGTAADRFKAMGVQDRGEYIPFGAEVQALLRGVELCGSALRREPDLQVRVERARQAEAERALKPALEPARAVEIERKPAPGLSLGLGF